MSAHVQPDFDVRSVQCPVNPEFVCPSRVHIEKLFATPQNIGDATPSQIRRFRPELDTLKCVDALADHADKVNKRGCIPQELGACGIGSSEASPRQTVNPLKRFMAALATRTAQETPNMSSAHSTTGSGEYQD